MSWNYADAERQIRVKDCNRLKLWITFSLWCRDLHNVIRALDANNGFIGKAKANRDKLFSKSFQQIMAGEVPFTTKRDYIFIAKDAFFPHWRDTQTSWATTTEYVRSKVILIKHDEVKLEDLNDRMKVNVAYTISSLREAFGTFTRSRMVPPMPSTVSQEMRAIGYHILETGTPDHPILADAAEDAGYCFTPVLDHLRKGPFGSGPNWAVLAVLGLHPYQREDS